MTTVTKKQIPVNADLVLREFVVSDASTFKSKDGTRDLVSVTLVGKKRYTALPASLYFGEMTFAQVEDLIGQSVDFTFTVNSRGMTITEIYPKL